MDSGVKLLFLLLTRIVSARLEGSLEYNLDTLSKLIQSDTIFLWTTPLLLACTLLFIKRWVKHGLTDAIFFLSILVLFYFFVAVIPDLGFEDLRSRGWVFEAAEAGVPFYHFYTLYGMPISHLNVVRLPLIAWKILRLLVGQLLHPPFPPCLP
jgi:SulP family sulfate permease